MKRLRLKPLRRNAPCPACLDRDALNPMGQPLFVGGVRRTAGCEICGGKGRVDLAEEVGRPSSDPWVVYRDDTPKRKAHRPKPAEPGPRVHYVHEFKKPKTTEY